MLKDAPVSVIEPAKERMVEEQRRIEEIKDYVGGEVKNLIENTQTVVASEMIVVVKDREVEAKATEFAVAILEVVSQNVIVNDHKNYKQQQPQCCYRVKKTNQEVGIIL